MVNGCGVSADRILDSIIDNKMAKANRLSKKEEIVLNKIRANGGPRYKAFRLDALNYMSCKVCKNKRFKFKDRHNLDSHLKSIGHMMLLNTMVL
jgi:hypothetical protein